MVDGYTINQKLLKAKEEKFQALSAWRITP